MEGRGENWERMGEGKQKREAGKLNLDRDLCGGLITVGGRRREKRPERYHVVQGPFKIFLKAEQI